jgi:predicted nucleic acid-binding protein
MAVSHAPPDISLALDNDVLTHWRSKQPYALSAIADYQTLHKVVPALTSMTVFEALTGIESEAAKNKNVERYRVRAELLIRNCTVLPFDQKAAAIAAQVFPRLSRSDRNKLWRDVFICCYCRRPQLRGCNRQQRTLRTYWQALTSRPSLVSCDLEIIRHYRSRKS